MCWTLGVNGLTAGGRCSAAAERTLALILRTAASLILFIYLFSSSELSMGLVDPCVGVGLGCVRSGWVEILHFFDGLSWVGSTLAKVRTI